MEASIVIKPSTCYPYDDCSVCIRQLLRLTDFCKNSGFIGCFAERPNCTELKNKVIKVTFSFRCKYPHLSLPWYNHNLDALVP